MRPDRAELRPPFSRNRRQNDLNNARTEFAARVRAAVEDNDAALAHRDRDRLRLVLRILESSAAGPEIRASLRTVWTALSGGVRERVGDLPPGL